MTPAELLSAYHAANDAVWTAKLVAEQALRAACPPGSVVFWSHGDIERQATVRFVYGDDVHVTGPTGAEYRVHGPRIERVRDGGAP